MEIKTKFFGTVALNTDEIFDFAEGIPGFEQIRRFIWLQPENSAFSCLQAVDRTEVAFITISPFLICSDYSFELEDQIAKQLGLEKLEDTLLLALVTIPEGSPQESTANLKAPVVINCKTRRGYQVILNEDYALRTPLINPRSSDDGDKKGK
jgi:flagellar assembly factor FliW